jgi:hypothetical protein
VAIDDDPPEAAPDPAPAETDAGADAETASGGLANLRARDVMTRRPEELAAELSPTEVEQLSRWFGLPSFTQLAEDGAAVPGDGDSGDAIADFDGIFANIPGFYIAPEEIKKTQEARQRALAAVEPAMLDRLERHLGTGDALRVFRPSLEVRVEPERFERRFVTNAAVDVTEVAPPEWLADALGQNVPQALLRDLHRPVYERPIDEGDPFAEPEPPFDPLRDVRAVVATRYHFTTVQHGLPVAREGLDELAAIKASRWSEIRTHNRRIAD